MSINFFKGHPSVLLLPHQELADAYQKVLLENKYPEDQYENNPDNRHPLQYGSDRGNLEIRRAIADWSSRRLRRPPAHPDTFSLTNGLSFGAGAVLSACTSPHITEHAFLVSPTYFLISHSFVDYGFGGRMSSVEETPGEEYDIDLELLERRLTQLNAEHGLPEVDAHEINIVSDLICRGSRKFYRYVMYLVPTFSNPGGMTYSQKTRTKLLQIARKNDMLLLCDDVYDFLSYRDHVPPPKLNHIDADTIPEGWRFGNTVSNASFSKIVAPGLRVGWHEASKGLAHQLATIGTVKSGGTPSQLNSFVVRELILSGSLDRIITNFASTYRLRAATMLDAIRKYLPMNYTTVREMYGGYFLWVQLKAYNVDLAETIRKVANEHGVVIADGSNFEVLGDPLGWGQSHARLCVAFLSEEQIERGIMLWGDVIQRDHPDLY